MPKTDATAEEKRSQAELFDVLRHDLAARGMSTRHYGGKLAESARKRDEALAQVEENAAPWFERALAAAPKALGRAWMGIPLVFTGEDLRDALTITVGEPHSSNAWGSLVRKLLKDGVIQRTGAYRPSRRPSSHAHLTPEYRVPWRSP